MENITRLSHQFKVSGKEVEIAALGADIIPERYVRNVKSYTSRDQVALLTSTVSVVGLGVLGGGVTEILARSGVGNLNLIDGDTFVVNRKIGGTNKIRLSNYDAPEKYQYGGRRATNRLRGFIGGKKVSISPVGRSYDRVVAKVTQNRRNISKRMRR